LHNQPIFILKIELNMLFCAQLTQVVSDNSDEELPNV